MMDMQGGQRGVLLMARGRLFELGRTILGLLLPGPPLGNKRDSGVVWQDKWT
jgi:hypothetical protein